MGVQDEQAELPGDAGVSPLRRPSFWRRAGAAFLRLWGLWLVGLLLLTVPPIYRAVKPSPPPDSSPPSDNTESRADLRDLETALRQGDDAAVLDFFRRRRLSGKEREEVRELVEKLGDPAFRTRQHAAEVLTRKGPRVAGLLRRAARHPDVAVTDQARDILARLTKDVQPAPLSKGVSRLVDAGLADTVAVLLDYYPDAESDTLAGEVLTAIEKLGFPAGQPDRALVKALADPEPGKRAAAGMLLARVEGQRPALRKLCGDADGDVRFRVALALLAYGDKQAIRTLAECLPELPPAEAWQALDALYRAGGPTTPAVPLHQRERCRDAWLSWFVGWDGKPGVASVEPRPRGATLLVQMELRSSQGDVQQITPAGMVKGYVDGLDYPVWACILPSERILVVEHRGDRVSEYALSGDRLWSVTVHRPIFAQRLTDGRTFIVCRDALYEATRDGSLKVIASWPERVVATARRCEDGQLVVLTDSGTCLFLDPAGKELRRFETGCRMVFAPGIDVTANRRVLIPDHGGNRVVEFGPTGEVLWQVATASPTSVQRLPEGGTLVTSTMTREVFEVDRLGRTTWRLSEAARTWEKRGPTWRPVAATRQNEWASGAASAHR